MIIGLARGAGDTRDPNNFQKTKSNMAAATSLNHYNGNNSFCICDRDIYLESMIIGLARGARDARAPNNFNKKTLNPESIKMAKTLSVFVVET